MQTLRGLGQTHVSTSLNLGVVFFFQRCIPGMKSCSTYVSVYDPSPHTFEYIGRCSTNVKYMRMLSLNSYTLDNTNTGCTSTYRQVYFGSPSQVILTLVKQVDHLVYCDTLNTPFEEIACPYINPCFSKVVYYNSQLLGKRLCLDYPL